MWTIYGDILETNDVDLNRSVTYINSDPGANAKIVKLVISGFRNTDFTADIHLKKELKYYQSIEKDIIKFKSDGILFLTEDLNTIKFISKDKEKFGLFVRSVLLREPNLPVDVIWQIEKSLRIIRSLRNDYPARAREALYKTFGYMAYERMLSNIKEESNNNNQTELSTDSNLKEEPNNNNQTETSDDPKDSEDMSKKHKKKF